MDSTISTRKFRLVWLALIFALGGWIGESRAFAGFGATPAECEAAYGKTTVVTANKMLVCPRTRGYVKDGLSILVGFDEQDRAEEFIYSKAVLGTLPDLSEKEQKSLLDEYKEGSAWGPHPDNGDGPIWQRADGGAYASYMADSHWLVIMNKHCMDRFIKDLHQRAGSAQSSGR